MKNKMLAKAQSLGSSIIKSSSQVNSEHQISRKKRLVEAAQEINEGLKTGGRKPHPISLSRSQDMGYIESTAGHRRDMSGMVEADYPGRKKKKK